MKHSLGLTLGTVALAALSTAQVRIANDGRANKVPVPRAGLTKQDLTFMSDAAISNMFEIATSKVALAQASTPWAKEFAKEMVDEHTGAQNELGLIEGEGVGPPRRTTAQAAGDRRQAHEDLGRRLR